MKQDKYIIVMAREKRNLIEVELVEVLVPSEAVLQYVSKTKYSRKSIS